MMLQLKMLISIYAQGEMLEIYKSLNLHPSVHMFWVYDGLWTKCMCVLIIVSVEHARAAPW